MSELIWECTVMYLCVILNAGFKFAFGGHGVPKTSIFGGGSFKAGFNMTGTCNETGWTAHTVHAIESFVRVRRCVP